ncbi:hypothetical protein ACQ27_gp402 [Klebsiella phage K64-1]|nr:hypothetical protein ACQ27_gp402 [Klebsiella phage K64-1]
MASYTCQQFSCYNFIFFLNYKRHFKIFKIQIFSRW